MDWGISLWMFEFLGFLEKEMYYLGGWKTILQHSRSFEEV